jgi:hypothetical protein
MAEGTFSLRYEGPAVADGRMRVADLAPALLALGDMVATTHRIVHPTSPPLEVDIRSTREGSFVVDMLAVIAEETGKLLVSDEAGAIADTIAIVTGVHGIFDYLRILAGRRVVDVTPTGDVDVVRVTVDDGVTIDAPATIVQAGASIEVRRSAKYVVAPLRRDGFDAVSFDTDEVETTVRIGRTDVDAFDLPDIADDETIAPIHSEVVLRPRTVSLEADGSWKMTDGQGRPLTVTFEDEAFVRRVQRAEQPIGLGDRLVVRLRTEPSPGRRWDRHFVGEVSDHLRHTETQEVLDLDDDTD